MTTILPPDTSMTFIAAAIIPLILGFLVGIVTKGVFKLGVAIALIILILMAIGILAPGQVIGNMVSLVRTGQALASKVNQIAGYLPYSSITFIMGAVIGFFKG